MSFCLSTIGIELINLSIEEQESLFIVFLKQIELFVGRIQGKSPKSSNDKNN